MSRSSAAKSFGSLSDFAVFNTSCGCSASTMPMAWIAERAEVAAGDARLGAY
jgi:hypothetical protein